MKSDQRYIAFLRAINVGGRNVTMETLRSCFLEAGFSNVESFIASGNIIFENRRKAVDVVLEKMIEKTLLQALGYEVVTFVRTVDEVAAIAAYEPFSQAAMAAAGALNVALLNNAPDADVIERIKKDFNTEVDDFQVHGRELYWLCKKKQSESRFSNAAFERRSKLRATFRSVTTIRKLAEKYGGKES